MHRASEGTWKWRGLPLQTLAYCRHESWVRVAHWAASPMGLQPVHGERKLQSALPVVQPHITRSSHAASPQIESCDKMLEKLCPIGISPWRKAQRLCGVKKMHSPEAWWNSCPRTDFSFWNVSQRHLLTKFSNCLLKCTWLGINYIPIIPSLSSQHHGRDLTSLLSYSVR